MSCRNGAAQRLEHHRFYDGTSNRVKKISPSGSTTYYIGEHFEVKDTQQVKYIFAGNLRIAKVSNTEGTVYFHKDHLGSSAAMTSTSGAILEETNYMPFGEIREHTGLELSNYKFTDQEFDPETGLYYYGARYYDPTIGRFISADSVVPDPYDPQTLNRYSYCRNNPIIYTDPSGHTPWHVVALVIAAVSATTAAIQTGSQGNWDLLDMAGSAGMAFITTFVSAAVGSGASSVIGSTVAGGAIGGAFGGSWSSLAYGGNVAEGALYGAIGGAIGGATGGIDIGGVGVGVGDVAFRVAAAGITSGIIAELSGAKFSQGVIPAMITAAAVSLSEMASKKGSEKGIQLEVPRARRAIQLRLDLAKIASEYAEEAFFRDSRNQVADSSGQTVPPKKIDFVKLGFGLLGAAEGIQTIALGGTVVAGTAMLTKSPTLTSIVGLEMLPVFSTGVIKTVHGVEMMLEGIGIHHYQKLTPALCH